jgi:hypothetical protein
VVCDKYYLYDRREVDKLKVITYNPYKSSSFTIGDKVITSAEKVICRNGKCYFVE